MRAAAFIGACLAVGFAVGWVYGRIRKADEFAAESVERCRDCATNWRAGHAHGQREGEAKGYAEGWTSGRIALVGEQEAQRRHPTGSPLSALKALDAEADRRMRGDA